MSDFVELNLLVEKYVADEVAQKGLAEIALTKLTTNCFLWRRVSIRHQRASLDWTKQQEA